MTSTIFWVLLAVTVAVCIGIGIGIRELLSARAAQDASLPAPDTDVHGVAKLCRSNGHAYRAYEAGWRCARCGNHVSSREGEQYGLAKEGRVERRRQQR
jgi:hypothetical protein